MRFALPQDEFVGLVKSDAPCAVSARRSASATALKESEIPEKVCDAITDAGVSTQKRYHRYVTASQASARAGTMRDSGAVATSAVLQLHVSDSAAFGLEHLAYQRSQEVLRTHATLRRAHVHGCANASRTSATPWLTFPQKSRRFAVRTSYRLPDRWRKPFAARRALRLRAGADRTS